ncbi:MAG: hypothetical protein BWY31_04786 [Lentisphaerae bacterium ADurb.Bin242]|nr:MAG: hypothetical protein BWY31_04786 [Lentisphaerae bacterium ADurb.Bin242]
MPESVADISIGTKLEALNFLCTAMYVKAKPGECIGTCMVRYADGSGAEIPFARGKEIDDWFPPMIGKDVKVAETVRLPGGGERASFIASWKNPHPEKEIKNISFKSEGNALWAIIAVSGENLPGSTGLGNESLRKVGMDPEIRKASDISQLRSGHLSGRGERP